MNKGLLKEISELSKKHEMFVMGDLYYLDICWKSNSAKLKMLDEILTCVADIFSF